MNTVIERKKSNYRLIKTFTSHSELMSNNSVIFLFYGKI